MTKPTGDSFDNLTAELLSRAPTLCHNVSHGSADALEVAGFLGLMAAHLHELDERHRGALARALTGGDHDDYVTPSSLSAAKVSEQHRHKFDAAGKCTIGDCTHVKGRGGRPRNQPAEPASEALPSVVEPGYRAPAPRLAGDAAADRFLAGGAGGSTGRPDAHPKG
jgi:hypothetical protein